MSLDRGRRGLIAAALLATSSLPFAQSSGALRRLGFLALDAAGSSDLVRDLAARLNSLGWVEGRNLRVEVRYVRSIDELDARAAELVRARVDVIVANGPNPTRAAMRATSTVPIVFAAAYDPVASGLVASLARPGRNVTGVASAPELLGKELSLLKELMPTVQRVGVLETADNPQFAILRAPFEQACRSLGLEARFVRLATAQQIDGAVAELVAKRVQALFLFGDSFAAANGKQMIAAALRHRLPSLASVERVRRDGALMSYTGKDNRVDRTAYLVDRILRGATPSDLPVEQPMQFHLAINLGVARTLGLTVPKAMMLRADELVE